MHGKYKLLILTRQDDAVINEVYYHTLSCIRAAVESFFFTDGEPNLRSLTYYYRAWMWSDEDNDYIGIYIQ